MGELTYEVPVVGEKHQASDSRVSTALTQIRNTLNGQLEAVNVKKETLTPKKFVKPTRKSQGQIGKNILPGGVFEQTVSQNTAVSVGIEGVTTKLLAVFILVGGAQIAVVQNPFPKRVTMPVGPFRVPAGETWTLENSGGSTNEVAATSEYTYETGVV